MKRKIDTGQLSIFDYLQNLQAATCPTRSSEGTFDYLDRLRDAMAEAIKTCPSSRHQIAGEMSHLLGTPITKPLIDSWTKKSDEANRNIRRHIPAEYLPAFCHVTGCNEALVIMGQMVGLFVLPGPEALRAEIQREEERRLAIGARIRERKALLAAVENKAD